MKKIIVLLLIFIAVFTFTGCSIARRPAPKPSVPQEERNMQTPTPDRNSDGDLRSTPSTPNERTLASKLARAAETVDGVKSATVVVSGSTAFVGLDLDSDAEKDLKEIKNRTADVVKRTDSSIKAVNVTADPNLVTRLKKLAKGIQEGRPVSSFAEELAEIARKISPETSTK